MDTTIRDLPKWILVFGLFFFSYVITGCRQEQVVVSPQTPTQVDTFTPAAPSTHTPTLTDTATPTLTHTPTPTATATPTSTSTPFPDLAVISPSINLHTGPGEAYPVAAQVSQGSLLQLRGRTEDDSWLLVSHPSGKGGWVSADAVDLNEIVMDTIPVESSFSEPPPPIAGWRGDPVQVVCVNLEGKYTGTYASTNPDSVFEVSDPKYQEILTYMEEYLTLLGLTAGKAEGECHAALTVNLTINQLSASYTAGNKNYTCYSGVSVSSNMTLSDGQNAISYANSYSRPLYRVPTMSMSECKDSTYFTAESIHLFLLTADRWWGSQALALPLKKGTETSTDYYLIGYSLDAIRSLGLFGKGYTPELIGCFKDNCYHYPMGTVRCSGECPTPEERWLRTMKSITGQDFQYDTGAWQDWWNGQNK